MSGVFTAEAVLTFPAEAVPDGNIFGPHHGHMGPIAALIVAWVVSDDLPSQEPVLYVLTVCAAWFAFLFVWPYYHAAGAVLSLVGLLAALVAVLLLPFWADYAWLGWRGAALLAVLVGLDDVVEHAFGLATPLDWLWKAHIVQHIH